jgi:hypothetical protein
MTVHWNARKGFQIKPNGVSASGNHAGEAGDDLAMADLLLAMRNVPDVRSAAVHRARKLLADPNYPSPEVLRKVAGLLARHLAEDQASE